MRVSDSQVARTARWEGLRLGAYKPVSSERYYTIGYGHYGPDVKRGMRITRTRALQLLKRDMKTAEDAVNKYVKVGLNQHRFNALVDLVFNIGVGNFRNSTLLKELNRKHYSAVPNQIMRWTRDASGRVLPGLVNRRREEVRIWNL